jgi:hypothetical protein
MVAVKNKKPSFSLVPKHFLDAKRNSAVTKKT